MPDIIMMVGLPYSGKSYVAESMGLHCGRTVISSDAIVQQYAKSIGKHYNDVFSSYASEAQLVAANSLIQAVARSESILIDQTNLTKASRSRKMVQIPDNYRKVCINVPVPCADELELRKMVRCSHQVPDAVLEYMNSIYQVPSFDEGFDVIYTAGFDDIILTN